HPFLEMCALWVLSPEILNSWQDVLKCMKYLLGTSSNEVY
ncbi:15659_t:CDS:2, partial [Entrophospora sp. SA101]